jgi:hypothetical protein
VVAAIVAFAILASRRRADRRDWDSRLVGATTEATWLAHDLVPQLLDSPDAERRRSGWAAQRPRVETLRARLGEVVEGAPDEPNRLRTSALLTAVTAVVGAFDADAAAPPDDTEHVGAVRSAQVQLEEALRGLQPPPTQPATPPPPSPPTQPPSPPTQPPSTPPPPTPPES